MSTKPQITARKATTLKDFDTPCSHPLCGDHTLYFDRVKGEKPVPHCLAHHLEFKYLQHVERQRARYVPTRRENLKPCGTPAAAARHRRRKEPVCDPCRIADNERTAAHKAATKAIRERSAA